MTEENLTERGFTDEALITAASAMRTVRLGLEALAGQVPAGETQSDIQALVCQLKQSIVSLGGSIILIRASRGIADDQPTGQPPALH